MKLHSNIIGQGQAMIILHGFLGTSDNWKTLGKRFSEQGFEVHLVDQRNHGRSPHDDHFNYKLLMEDLKTYCVEHQLEKSSYWVIPWVEKRPCSLRGSTRI